MPRRKKSENLTVPTPLGMEKEEEQFNEFHQTIKEFDPLNMQAPQEEVEQQTKLSKRETKRSDAPTLSPIRTIARRNDDKAKTYWDEKHAKAREFDRQYVKIIAENREIVNEMIELWTGKYGCDPLEFWNIPVNKPVYVPRYVADNINKAKYHVMVMEDKYTGGSKDTVQFVGAMVASKTRNRLAILSCADDMKFSYAG